MSAPSGLAWPPAETAALGVVPGAALPLRLHRLSHWPAPWWFASAGRDDRGGGRFDLPLPQGTCYLADDLEGALLETLLRKPRRIVPSQQLDRLLHVRVAVVKSPPTADLTAPVLTGVGINAEISTTLDYAKPRAWALALRGAGWGALRYALRGDSALRQRGVALFGSAGLHSRAPAGMRTAVAALDPFEATALLRERGVAVHSVPFADEVTVEPR